MSLVLRLLLIGFGQLDKVSQSFILLGFKHELIIRIRVVTTNRRLRTAPLYFFLLYKHRLLSSCWSQLFIPTFIWIGSISPNILFVESLIVPSLVDITSLVIVLVVLARQQRSVGISSCRWFSS